MVGTLNSWTRGMILRWKFTHKSNHFNASLGNKPTGLASLLKSFTMSPCDVYFCCDWWKL